MYEMEESDNFKILTDLTHFFLDHRSACYTFVNTKTVKNILDLKLHISKMLNISNFYLQFKEHYLPETEDIQLLKEGDVIRVIKMEDLQRSSNQNEFNPTANSTLLHAKEQLNGSQDFQEKISYFERKTHTDVHSDDLTDDKTFKSKLNKVLDKQITKCKEQIKMSTSYNTPINRFKLQCVKPRNFKSSYSTIFKNDGPQYSSSLRLYDVTIEKPSTSLPKRMCTSLTISKLENKEL